MQTLSRDQHKSPRLSVWLTACACLLLAGALALRVATLNGTGFDADEYAFALVARDILAGKLPYSGIFDNKPVGLNYLFALAEWLGGQNVIAIHMLGLIAASVSAWLIVLTARRLHAPMAAALALAALFLLEMLWLGGWASMSEVIAAPLLCLANYRVVARPDGPSNGQRGLFLAIGVIAGLACQITYLTAPGFGLATLGLLVGGERRSLAERSIEGLLAALGLAAAISVVWLPQILSGDWPDYMREQLAYHGHYRLPAPPGWLWRENFFLPVIGLGLPLAAIWAIQLLARRLAWPPRAFWIIALQLIGALIAACASNRLYTHYLILALPAFTVLPAVIARGSPARLWTRITMALLLCGGAAAALPVPYLLKHLNPQTADQVAASFITRTLPPGRPILVFNASHAIYYLSRRPAVTRYVFPTHYIASCAGGEPEKSTAAYLAEGLNAHPALLVAGSLCAVDIDVAAMARQHGYVPIRSVIQPGTRIDIYAPQGEVITAADPSA